MYTVIISLALIFVAKIVAGRMKNDKVAEKSNTRRTHYAKHLYVMYGVYLIFTAILLTGCDVGSLEKRLLSKNPDTRESAAKAMGDTRESKYVEPLLNALNDPDVLVQITAIESLGMINDRRCVVPLLSLLNSKDKAVRKTSIIVLGKFNDRSTIEPLIGCLLDKEQEVRSRAAEALGNLRDQRATLPLINCLNEGNLEVNTYAVGALGKLRDIRSIEPLFNCMWQYQLSNSVRIAFKEIGAEAGAFLVAKLKSPDSHTCIYAAELLAVIPDENYIAPLRTRLLMSDNIHDALAIADALLSIGVNAIPVLINCLESGRWEVRESVAAALGKSGDTRALIPLCKKMTDPDIGVRFAAVSAVANLKDKRAIPYLTALLPNTISTEEIFAALDSLGWKPTTDSEKTYYWVNAKDRKQIAEHGKQTKPILLSDLNSGTKRAVFAANALIFIGNNEVIPAMQKALTQTGNQRMAEMYLNCGNQILEDSAEKWAKNHGYNINSSSTTGYTTWGSNQ